MITGREGVETTGEGLEGEGVAGEGVEGEGVAGEGVEDEGVEGEVVFMADLYKALEKEEFLFQCWIYDFTEMKKAYQLKPFY